MSSIIPQEELQNFSWLLESWSWSFVGAIKGMGCAQPKWEAIGEVEVLGVPAPAPVVAEPATPEAPVAEASSEEVSGEDAPVAEEAAAAAPEPEPAPVEAAPAQQDEELLWWGQSFNIHGTNCVWFGASEHVRQYIGRVALIAAGLDQPEAADLENTYQELAATAMSSLATRLTARCDREVVSLAGHPMKTFQTRGVARQVSIEMASGEKLKVTFAASSEFLRLLVQTGFYRESGWISRDQRSGDRRGPGARAGAAGAAERSKPSGKNEAIPIDSVLDMDIPVSISFGTARLRLDEALRLHDGSVVVLNKTIDELVELQVNGRVVARGEIMAARGQYGIRIRELASQGERMGQVEASLNSQAI